MTGLTLEEQIELLRTVAMLCSRAAADDGSGRSAGWRRAGQKWDAVRQRLEAERDGIGGWKGTPGASTVALDKAAQDVRERFGDIANGRD